jgi:hypothetical protein
MQQSNNVGEPIDLNNPPLAPLENPSHLNHSFFIIKQQRHFVLLPFDAYRLKGFSDLFNHANSAMWNHLEAAEPTKNTKHKR